MLWKQQPRMIFEPIEVLSASTVVEKYWKANDNNAIVSMIRPWSRIKNSKIIVTMLVKLKKGASFPKPLDFLDPFVENPSKPSPILPLRPLVVVFLRVFFPMLNQVSTSKTFPPHFAESFPLVVQRRHPLGRSPGSPTPAPLQKWRRVSLPSFAANDREQKQTSWWNSLRIPWGNEEKRTVLNNIFRYPYVNLYQVFQSRLFHYPHHPKSLPNRL